MEEKKKEEKPEEQLLEEYTFQKALLEFQIETKEAAIDQVLCNLKQVEEKNKEYHERNNRLKEEQQAHIRRILRKIEEKEKEQDEKEVVTRHDVEESLQATWQYTKDKEQLLKESAFFKEIEELIRIMNYQLKKLETNLSSDALISLDLRSRTEETDQKLSAKQSERDYWLEYKNVGSKTHANKIKNLEKDIKEVKDDLHRATEYYRKALKAVKEENGRLVELYTKKSKEQAPESAVRYLDKSSIREIEENEWLKEEVKVYRKKVRDLKASIQLLEEENINLVTKLIDGKLRNLKVPRHLCLTQAAGLQGEFSQDEIKAVEPREYSAKTDGEESLKSAAVPCQKRKSSPKIQSETEDGKAQDSDEELQEKALTPLLNRLYEVEQDFQEYLKLGPLESKLMCVIGRAMPIHKEPEEMPGRSPMEGGSMAKSNRHITAEMIKALTKEQVG